MRNRDRQPRKGVFALIGVLLSASLCAGIAHGATQLTEKPAFREPLPDLATLVKGSAMKHANLSEKQCRTRLKDSGLPHQRVYGGASGIATPLRLSGPINDVKFLTAGPKSKFSLLDCRMALSLNELATVLAAHDVTEIRIDSFYRPKAHLYGRKRAKLSQHAYGLAMDVTAFKLKDGRTLEVERDFHGKIGEPVCGPGAEIVPPSPDATALRNLVCDIARTGMFHNVLTPNYNTAHRNHFHFDITRNAKTIGIR
jgi:hypothetical protein